MGQVKVFSVVAFGVVVGMFMGGLILAVPRFNFSRRNGNLEKPKADLRSIKHQIVYSKSMSAYRKLKDLSGGTLRKEDLFYALIINDSTENDTVYSDLRQALVEIYCMPPRDTLTLKWIHLLDEKHEKYSK